MRYFTDANKDGSHKLAHVKEVYFDRADGNSELRKFARDKLPINFPTHITVYDGYMDINSNINNSS